VLALWSLGIVLAHSCGQTQVVTALASYLHEKPANLRQRLREWCWNRADKAGRKRSDWAVRANAGPLLSWVLALWPPEEKRLALALDATSLKKRFVVLSLSVVFRGSAIPVAWAVLPEGQKGAWKQPWLEILESVRGTVPADWCVLVLADRGLYARWLYEAIQANGWHPFLRLNRSGYYRPKGAADFRPMKQLLSAPGQIWYGAVTCFATNSVEASLLACWEAGYQGPWLILTDLAPETAAAKWYGLRSWIEAGFKDLKSGGWQWQNTRMSDPTRVARFWLALALATLWVLNVGGEREEAEPRYDVEALPETHWARRTKRQTQGQRRWVSCFRRGLLAILTDMIHQEPVRLCLFRPEPWPEKTYP
jgi:hypothetical protein